MPDFHTKKLHKDVYSSFIHNTPKLETTQMTKNSKMRNKQQLYSYNGILCSSEKE